jgi:hypothetical protein
MGFNPEDQREGHSADKGGPAGLGSMTRRELVFPLVLAAMLAALGAVPCLYGHMASDNSLQFDHNPVFRGDFDQYFSFIRQAAEGQWLFHNQFTPEPHGNVFFNLEFLTTGKLAALLGVTIEYAYMIVGALGTLLLVFSLYWLCCFFLETTTMRRLVVTTSVLGGGFGWLNVFESPAIKRFHIIDSYTGLHPFFWILLQTHFLLAEGLSLLALCFFLRGEKRKRTSDYVWSGVACAMAGAVRPYDMLYLFCVFSLFTFIIAVCHRDRSPRSIVRRITPILIALSVMLYYVCLFQFHLVFRWWSLQGVAAPSPVSGLALGMGFTFFLLLCALGYLGRFGDKSKSQVVLASCVLCGFGLYYSYPALGFAGQLGTVLVIPATLLGTISLERPVCTAAQKSRWVLCGLLLFIMINSLTSAAVFVRTMREVNRREPFISTDVVRAYHWLQENSGPREVVIGDYRNCNRIPHYCHNSCITGYGFSTVDCKTKNTIVRAFFCRETTDTYRRHVIDEFQVRYVFWGKEEKELGDYDPNTSPFLRCVFSNEATAIYEVVDPQ